MEKDMTPVIKELNKFAYLVEQNGQFNEELYLKIQDMLKDFTFGDMVKLTALLESQSENN